jgi:hypothetical protein
MSGGDSNQSHQAPVIFHSSASPYPSSKLSGEGSSTVFTPPVLSIRKGC